LIVEPVGRRRRGQRTDSRRVGRGIGRLDRGDGGGELLQERLVELVDDDEALAGVTRLPGSSPTFLRWRCAALVAVVGYALMVSPSRDW
jgi:hypothetical protein